MADTQHFCLRWNNYQSSITSAFENLRDDEDFVDVTLACDGKSLKAHRVVLSACSPYFRELLKSTPCKHPVIVLQDVAFADLHALVEFIYHGEVNVHQRNLSSFLKTAEVLRVSGLTQKAEEKEEDLSQSQNSGRSNQHGYSDKLVDDGLFTSPPSPSLQGTTTNQLMRRAPPMGHRERHNSGDFSDLSDQHSPNKRVRPGEVAASNNLENTTSTPNMHGTPSSPFSSKQPQGPKLDDLDRDSSQSPPATDGVKSEPMELFGDGENSTDSVHDEADSVQALQAPSPYLSAASESKLFASATPSGSFNFSMAALAADATNLSNLNAQPLPPNSDGTPGTSSQVGLAHHQCDICGKLLSSKLTLKRHKEQQHLLPLNRAVCPVCRKVFRTLNSLNNHKSIYHRRNYNFYPALQ